MKLFYTYLAAFLVVSSLMGQGENLLVPEYKPFGIPLVSGIGSFDLIDLNNDNIPDLVAAFVRNDTSIIHIKYGPDFDEVLTSPDYRHTFFPKKRSQYVAFSDIDGDLDYDLYIGDNAAFEINAPITVLENKSNGNLLFEVKSIPVFESEYILAVPSPVDYDGDGKEDLFVSDYNGNNVVYKNNGSFSFTKLDNALGLDDFNISASFSRLPNTQNLLAFDYINGFRIMLFDGVQYNRDTTNSIINNPDLLDGDFYQVRIRDINNDNLPDAFLSCNAFNPQFGFLTDTYLYKGTCVDILYKNEIPVVNATYSASNLISSAGEIDSPLGVTYKAGNSIELNPNFTIKAGALFEAIIQDCPGQ